MAGYVPDNKQLYFLAQAALADSEILPAQNINFELRRYSPREISFDTFDLDIHSGVKVQCDQAYMRWGF